MLTVSTSDKTIGIDGYDEVIRWNDAGQVLLDLPDYDSALQNMADAIACLRAITGIDVNCVIDEANESITIGSVTWTHDIELGWMVNIR